jgi:hypothetical protein
MLGFEVSILEVQKNLKDGFESKPWNHVFWKLELKPKLGLLFM